MFSALAQRLRSFGPGLILAAAGIGAGDVVVASLTGIKFGTTLLWAIVITVALKFVVTEALARWQLATGETVVRAWVTRLPRWVALYFAAYLVLWTFLVGASLSSACGLAGASLFPAWPIPVWGVLHAVAAAILVAANRYEYFQRIMKVLIALMAACVLVCACLAPPPAGEFLEGLLIPRIPPLGGGVAVLGLVGGIGGSLTVICYAYWLRSAGWGGPEKLAAVRADVRLAYVFTGVFGVALCVIAAGVHAKDAGGSRIALEVAARLGTVAGPAARGLFLFGFWCTVFTAMLGVWQGVPHVFADFVAAWRERGQGPGVGGRSAVLRPALNDAVPIKDIAVRGSASHDFDPVQAEASQTDATLISAASGGEANRRVYLGALAYLAGPPLILLWFKQPVTVVLLFSIVGAFFMPFLAGTLLYLNNRRDWLGPLANRRVGNFALGLSLVAFGAVCSREIFILFRR